MNPLALFLTLAGGTLLSEDLACIAAGQLVRADRLAWQLAVLGCFAGIYLGDLGLWFTGRTLGRRVLRWRWLASRVSTEQTERFGHWFDRNSAAAILCSRFVPGARLPMYVGAGALGRKGWAFAGWTFLAALIWTPIVVLLVALLGDAFAGPFEKLLGHGWLAVAVVTAIAVVLLRAPRWLTLDHRWPRFIAAISRLWRWEFWPMGVFFLPLVPWTLWLAARHRSFMAITTANAGIPHGGIVGESKYEILAKIRSSHVIPSWLIDAGDLDDRLRQLDDGMARHGCGYPIVLKPDSGQRGAGVKMIHTREEAIRYLARHGAAVLAQAYHPGPFEAGVFYYRFPGEPRGRIFSITDKHFPVLTGDGQHTLRQLIWRHPRFRMQAATFLMRHATHADRVLADGEAFELARAGNHCQGTMFRDGAHLITPPLEDAIDRVVQTFPGFHFGRFDVRYGDVEAFQRGEDFAIVELNGVTSESTNLYDPSWSILLAYRTLFFQWSLLFRIGAANRLLGAQPSRLRDVVRDAR
ncbi:MAG: VTT domain-containing protein, partial [Tepidisphaeraceae bacterium]